MSIARVAPRFAAGFSRSRLPQLSLLALVVAGVLALTAAVIDARGPLPGDIAATQLVQDMIGSWYSPVAHFFNHTVHNPGIPLLATLSIGGALARRRFDLALIFASVFLAGAFISGMKDLVDRPRPSGDFWIGETSGTFSFPSGHTIRSAAFFGSWFIVAPRIMPVAPATIIRYIAAGAIILTAVSRVWVGIHWTTDVAAALAIAFVMLSVLNAAQPLLERLNGRVMAAIDHRFRAEPTRAPVRDRS